MDERADVTKEIKEWFDKAMATGEKLLQTLNTKEEEGNNESRELEEATRQVKKMLEHRSARTISFMRKFHRDIHALHDGMTAEAIDARKSAFLSARASGAHKAAGGQGRARRKRIQFDSDMGSQGESDRGSVVGTEGAGAGSPRAGEVASDGGGGGGGGGVQRTVTVTVTHAMSAVPGATGAIDQEGPVRATASSPGDILRRGENKERAREEQASGDHKRKTKAKMKAAPSRNLAVELLDVISQQQEEIAHLKTKGDIGSKRVEALKSALEYVRALHLLEEIGGVTRQTLGARVKVLAELLMTEEGRALLAKSASEHHNTALEATVKTAQSQEEQTRLTKEIKDLEQEIRNHKPSMVEDLKERISKVKRHVFNKGGRSKTGTRSFDKSKSKTMEIKEGDESPGVSPRSPLDSFGEKSSGGGTPRAGGGGGGGGLAIAVEPLFRQTDQLFCLGVAKMQMDAKPAVDKLMDVSNKWVLAVMQAKRRAVQQATQTGSVILPPSDASAKDPYLTPLKDAYSQSKQKLQELREEHGELEKKEVDLKALLKELRQQKNKAVREGRGGNVNTPATKRDVGGMAPASAPDSPGARPGKKGRKVGASSTGAGGGADAASEDGPETDTWAQLLAETQEKEDGQEGSAMVMQLEGNVEEMRKAVSDLEGKEAELRARLEDLQNGGSGEARTGRAIAAGDGGSGGNAGEGQEVQGVHSE
eukprot:CAMPEP_0115418634 /NCGR_PEP_ID=MMETSP0271-20121206/24770_1 /TAXON_ID=71861 /ORGANISM="Scrippsiella trochoidea, Strain CCMP3099" /LENGTH=706 /DNA_ID=CAMNT_0002843117 /DNA_START=305 /DNA_END=2421 /DNA_ORIENTATION=+